MSPELYKKFSIDILDKSHDRTTFSSGVKLLDDYIVKQAGQDARKNVTVTYILYDNENSKVAGYYTLSSITVELKDLPEQVSKKLPHYPLLPATLIGRLAIDKSYQKIGLGELLLMNALNRSYKASKEVASIAVLVEALDNAAVEFYKKYNFEILEKHKRKLFLSMRTISKLWK